MSARASNYLRRFCIALSVATIVVGLFSYFFRYAGSVGFLWKGAGDVVWTGCSSSSGTIFLDCNRMPRALYEAVEKIRPQLPSVMHYRILGGRFTIGYLQSNTVQFQWGFHFHRTDTQVPAPTTIPAAKPAITYRWRSAGIAIPLWFLFLLFSAYPLYCLIDLPNQRRRKRFDAGQCIACGYDLRHSPERCPECGAARKLTAPPKRTSIRGMLAFRSERWWQIGLYPLALAIYLFTFWRIYYSHL